MDKIKNIMLPIKSEFVKNIKSYYIFIILIGLYLLFFQVVDPHGTNCLIKHTIGLPCAGCGMTRAAYYLFTLDFKLAFFYHPLIYIMPVILLTVFLKGYGVFQKLYSSKAFWIIIVTLFITVYIIRMYLYYPNTAPMDHYFGR